MVTRDFSGDDVRKVLVNVGNFHQDRITGSHAILKYTNPDTGEKRTVSVPLHDRLRIGTLRGIADDAGANEFDEFCAWIDQNR